MRIIRGKYKNITLASPAPGSKIRPICDSNKELIFNILQHQHFGRDHQPAYLGQVADLFAGTGSLGIEALSRGAQSVCFVDRSIRSLSIVASNLRKLDAQASLIRCDATRLKESEQPYDLVFIDPPFFFQLAVPTLLRLEKALWVDNSTTIVLHTPAQEKLTIPENYRVVQQKQSTHNILFLRYRKPAST